MYYRAKGKSVCADVIPYYENGKFYLFYLNDYRDIENNGEGCPWKLLTTEDLVNYTDHGVVLPRGTVDEQDLYVFTGSCAKFNGKYYIFYTGHNPHKRKAGLPEQKVLLAESDDLYNWRKVKDFVFQAPDWLEMHDFRDPFVYYDEDIKKYCMLLAGRLKNENPFNCKGVTLIAYSDDLYNWEVSKKPFYAPSAYFTHECPDLFKMGDWWYLVFSEFTDKIVTTYRMAKSLNGPWITPKVNNFDGHAFYAAKSVSDGKRRIMFGWNCIKNNEKDYEFWQWGGTIIPHELVQAEDGTLYVKCPDEIKNLYATPVKIEDGFEMNAVVKSENGYQIGSNFGKSIKMMGKMPQNCKIEMDFTVADDIGDFGVILRSNQNQGTCYTVKFEPKFNRLAFDMTPRRDGNIHFQPETERYCPIIPGEVNKLVIIVEGSVVEVYVNDKVAMGARMFDYTEGDFGVYAHNTQIQIQNVNVCK